MLPATATRRLLRLLVAADSQPVKSAWTIDHPEIIKVIPSHLTIRVDAATLSGRGIVLGKAGPSVLNKTLRPYCIATPRNRYKG
jgi:hypothetical protein